MAKVFCKEVCPLARPNDRSEDVSFYWDFTRGTTASIDIRIQGKLVSVCTLENDDFPDVLSRTVPDEAAVSCDLITKISEMVGKRGTTGGRTIAHMWVRYTPQ
jgi:hypothetical protein